MAYPAGAIVKNGLARSPTGQLYVVILAAGAALPAGTFKSKGLAITPDGYLCVVLG